MSKTLLIKLQNIEIRNKQRYEYTYFSFCIEQQHHYFSSCFDQTTQTLTDDIPIKVPEDIPDILELHRWDNHTIIFTHQIDISDVKTRISVKKKHQTKNGEILSFMLILLQPNEIMFSHKYNSSISQHYMLVSNLHLMEKKNQHRADVGPSFFYLKTSYGDVVMPVTNGTLSVKLPDTLCFQYIKNGLQEAKAPKFESNQLTNAHTKLTLNSKNSEEYRLSMDLEWGVNLYEAKTQNTLLLEAHEFMIYDIEVKFDNYNEFSNAKIKFVYGNKAFELGNQFNSPKPTKIKKIIHFILKSEEQQITLVVQRNFKVIAHSRFYTDEVESFKVANPKRKIIDAFNGKQLGFLKFRCEKAKNLSTPQNNRFWKESNKKKMQNYVLLSMEQFSLNYPQDQSLSIVIKTQSQERIIHNIPNLEFFHSERQISYVPIVITAKPDENVYMMVKRANEDQQNVDINTTDFIGISIINFAELRLGMNTTSIQFFKNQEKTATVNCLINKITPYPFIKSVFQPQLLTNSMQRSLYISVLMKKIRFTSYYYTYRYDNKNEVYCIVEVNRVKKVLIMEHSNHDQLTLVSSAGSDTLNFVIEHTEFLKIKITFLVSDIGQDQQIYGSVVLKMKVSQLTSKESLDFHKMQIKNDFGTVVGQISTQISKTARQMKKEKNLEQEEQEYIEQPINRSIRISSTKHIQQSHKGPFKSQLKKVKNDIAKVNKSMEQVQKSIDNVSYKKQVNPIRNMIQYKALNNSVQVRQPRKPRYQQNNSIKYDNQRLYGQNKLKHNKSKNDSLKLPQIKKYKKNGLQELIQRMKIRKRTARGRYQSIQGQGSSSQRNQKRQSPFKNDDRSLTEEDKVKDQQISKKIKNYQEQIKELKDDLRKQSPKRQEVNRNPNSVEWEDNQFALAIEPKI